MNWQRYNYKVRLREDSSWQRSSSSSSRPIPSVLKPKGDVNDEEIYDDGTSITNIKVLGVKDKIAMFGPKPSVGNKPLPPALAKFHAMREDSGQGGTNVGPPAWKKPESPQSSEPSHANKVTPAWKKPESPQSSEPSHANKVTPAWKKPSPASEDKDKNDSSKTATTPSWKKPSPASLEKDKDDRSKIVTTPSWKKPSPTSVNKDTNEPNKTVTTPSWKKTSSPSEKADENKTVTNASTPPWKRPTVGQEKTTPPWKKPTPTTGKHSQPETDQNQNVPAWKRQSNKVNIPNKFGGTSPSSPSAAELQKVNIEEKPVNGTAPKPTPTSPSPSTKSSGPDSGQMFDPKALLRRTSTQDTTPKQITINPRQRLPDDGNSPHPPLNTPKSPSSNIPKHVTHSKTIVIRNGDGKKFEKLPKSSIITTELKPIKPLKLLGSNVKDIIAEYIKAFEEYKNANEELYDDVGNYIKPSEEQEVYDDVDNTAEIRSSNQSSNRPVSEIAAMTEEEEMREFGSAGSASGGSASISGGSMQAPITEEIYDDAEQDELYEPLPEDDEVSAQEDKKEQERKVKEAAERKKKEDKERKEREKKEKAEHAKLEKERKEKEKKEKEIRKKFKLTGDEKKSAEGVVRAKAKGGKLELAVEAGEILDIIRMTDNPAGKWLVMNREGTYGYVESKNIDIAETAIKKHTQDLANSLEAHLDQTL
ncbi:FYN-binding protein 1-like isoform X3 [Haliotis asinina]|uniref:FYN-binding protein 1-like isoform X3 n=1 Tax=Haliotis asinina TaxID=109174 RepID=UPI0035318AAA